MALMTLASEVSIQKNILFREMEGEAVLLNAETGIYFGLDSTGTAIWHAMQKKRRLKEVLESVLEEYDVDAEHCSQDILKFAGALQKNGLLKVDAN